MGALLNTVILIPFVLYGAWMVGIVALAARADLWEPRLAKDTLLWVIPGTALVFAAIKASSEHRFFRRRLREAVGLTVLLVSPAALC